MDRRLDSAQQYTAAQRVHRAQCAAQTLLQYFSRAHGVVSSGLKPQGQVAFSTLTPVFLSASSMGKMGIYTATSNLSGSAGAAAAQSGQPN